MNGIILYIALLGFVLVQSNPVWRRGKRSSSDEDTISISDDASENYNEAGYFGPTTMGGNGGEGTSAILAELLPDNDNAYNPTIIEHMIDESVVYSKRPMNAFMLWRKMMAQSLRHKYPQITWREILNLTARAWRGLSEEDKNPFVQEAARLRDIYKRYLHRDKSRSSSRLDGPGSASGSSQSQNQREFPFRKSSSIQQKDTKSSTDNNLPSISKISGNHHFPIQQQQQDEQHQQQNDYCHQQHISTGDSSTECPYCYQHGDAGTDINDIAINEGFPIPEELPLSNYLPNFGSSDLNVEVEPSQMDQYLFGSVMCPIHHHQYGEVPRHRDLQPPYVESIISQHQPDGESREGMDRPLDLSNHSNSTVLAINIFVVL